MYRLKNIVNDCALVKFIDNYLSYKKNNQLLFNEFIISINPLDWYYNKVYNYLIIKNYDWNSFIYNVEDKSLTKKELNLIIPIHSDNYLIATLDSKFVILNSENFEIISKIDTEEISFKYAYFEFEKLFLTKETMLLTYNIKRGNLLKQYNLSELGTYQYRSEGERSYEVQKFIGVVNNVLWVEISDWNLLALDIETGELIFRMDCRKFIPQNMSVGGGSESYMFDEKNKRIVWLSYTALFHIDLQNKEIHVVKDFWNVDKPDQWHFKGMILKNDKIYFTGSKGSENLIFKKRVGIMDSNTGEIIWNEYLDLPESKGLGTPQVSEDKLYVLATNGNLYIFEKEG